jgi:kynurenine 3-monooxygenase
MKNPRSSLICTKVKKIIGFEAWMKLIVTTHFYFW